MEEGQLEIESFADRIARRAMDLESVFPGILNAEVISSIHDPTNYVLRDWCRPSRRTLFLPSKVSSPPLAFSSAKKLYYDVRNSMAPEMFLNKDNADLRLREFEKNAEYKEKLTSTLTSHLRGKLRAELVDATWIGFMEILQNFITEAEISLNKTCRLLAINCGVGSEIAATNHFLKSKYMHVHLNKLSVGPNPFHVRNDLSKKYSTDVSFIDDREWFFPCGWTGKTDESSRKEIQEKVKQKFYASATFSVGGGSSLFDGYSFYAQIAGIRETEEIIVGIDNLINGGSHVQRIANLLHPHSIKLMLYLRDMFENVIIYKTSPTYYFTPEVHVVCLGLKKTDDKEKYEEYYNKLCAWNQHLKEKYLENYMEDEAFEQDSNLVYMFTGQAYASCSSFKLFERLVPLTNQISSDYFRYWNEINSPRDFRLTVLNDVDKAMKIREELSAQLKSYVYSPSKEVITDPRLFPRFLTKEYYKIILQHVKPEHCLLKGSDPIVSEIRGAQVVTDISNERERFTAWINMKSNRLVNCTLIKNREYLRYITRSIDDDDYDQLMDAATSEQEQNKCSDESHDKVAIASLAERAIREEINPSTIKVICTRRNCKQVLSGYAMETDWNALMQDLTVLLDAISNNLNYTHSLFLCHLHVDTWTMLACLLMLKRVFGNVLLIGNQKTIRGILLFHFEAVKRFDREQFQLVRYNMQYYLDHRNEDTVKFLQYPIHNMKNAFMLNELIKYNNVIHSSEIRRAAQCFTWSVSAPKTEEIEKEKQDQCVHVNTDMVVDKNDVASNQDEKAENNEEAVEESLAALFE